MTGLNIFNWLSVDIAAEFCENCSLCTIEDNEILDQLSDSNFLKTDQNLQN